MLYNIDELKPLAPELMPLTLLNCSWGETQQVHICPHLLNL